MTKAGIRKAIRVCGVFGEYTLRTGGLFGMPCEVPMTDCRAAFELQHALREEGYRRLRAAREFRRKGKHLIARHQSGEIEAA